MLINILYNMFTSILKNKTLKLFDVTLRDGLQSIPKIYTLKEKQQLFDNIVCNNNPKSIEIGSIVSPKILPQMNNSIELYKYATLHNNMFAIRPIDIYMLTPNYKSVEIACQNEIQNMSFITSVSNEFQEKNIRKTLNETKKEIEKMIEHVVLSYNNDETKIKLYISCINQCPINGIIDNHTIIDEIVYYYYCYNNYIYNYCLSDTCGTLNYGNFKYIIDEIIKRDIDVDKLSLHLHNQYDNNNLKHIITYAMKNGISNFDVSAMPDIGGCSVTMDNTNGNLSYHQIYTCIM